MNRPKPMPDQMRAALAKIAALPPESRRKVAAQARKHLQLLRALRANRSD